MQEYFKGGAIYINIENYPEGCNDCSFKFIARTSSATTTRPSMEVPFQSEVTHLLKRPMIQSNCLTIQLDYTTVVSQAMLIRSR